MSTCVGRTTTQAWYACVVSACDRRYAENRKNLIQQFDEAGRIVEQSGNGAQQIAQEVPGTRLCGNVEHDAAEINL